MAGKYYVYILTNRSRVLYTGMTNDLQRRIDEHKRKVIPCFTAKYRVDQLAWYQTFETAAQAIVAEKMIKGWLRSKKIELIQKSNPRWRDLSKDFGDRLPPLTATGEPVSARTSEGSRGVLRFAQDDGRSQDKDHL